MASIKFDYRELDIETMLGFALPESEEIARGILQAGVPILKRAVIKRASFHRNTGEMVRSIKETEPKKNRYGWYTSVRPTGKDSKGVRNMEKLAYLEYGAVHHGQPATPVLAPAVNECEREVIEAMQEEYNRRTGG